MAVYETLEAIDFPRVVEKQIYFSNAGLDTPSNRLHAPLDTHKTIINAETGEAISVVSDHYKLVRHEEVMGRVLEKVPDNFGQFSTKTWFSDNGGRMRSTLTFPERPYKIRKGDIINPTIEIINSYDTGWQASVIFGALRLVCTNGLTVGEEFFRFKRRHTQGLDLPHLVEGLTEGMERFDYQVRRWKEWDKQATSPAEYEGVIKTMNLGERAVEEIEREVEISSGLMLDDIKLRTLSFWLFFNIFAQYITHRVRSQVKQVELQARMRRAFN